MNNFDVDKCLESFKILVDSREQPTPNAKKRYKAFCAPYEIRTLDYGDYAATCTLPNGRELLPIGSGKRIKAPVVIERKMNLDELAGCFTRGRDRFKREFERAAKNGASVYLLVENATWENLYNGKYRSRFNPVAYTASITAWMARYDAKVIMCKAETSGKLIKDILFRELKERLKNVELQS